MFSFYGSKKRLAKYYPQPNQDIIIEPFCGSAQYSLHGNNWEKIVILYDIDDRIIDVWNYLIVANKSDIISLPMIPTGSNLDDFNLTKIEKLFLGYMIACGTRNPKKTATERSPWTYNKRQDIANNIHKINHWSARKLDFRSIPNTKATWFIDPPYEKAGKWYDKRLTPNDYKDLRKFCEERKGQVIVCEEHGASWITTIPLIENMGQTNNKKIEGIYYHENYIP